MSPKSPKTTDDLIAVMAALRTPGTGCPWDLEQTFETIAPYTIEEAYEVAEAIAHDDMNALSDELGDLLLQVVYHARIAEEAGHFAFADVVTAITDKMIRRHPHVFGDHVFGDARVADADAQTEAWEAIKAGERADKASPNAPPSALDGVALGLPALMRAVKLQKRAARIGFDWVEVGPIVDKMREELDELADEVIASDRDLNRVEEELGDLLFVAANLARRLEIDPESALRNGNAKFERRFRAVEYMIRAEGRDPANCDLDALDLAWNRVKEKERGSNLDDADDSN
ncbi:MAG: nucleoside triphosphate pyrophosphohydrolase [Sphingomonadales bacterium]